MNRDNKDQQKRLAGEGGSLNTRSQNSAADSSAAGRHYDKAEGEDISDEKTASDAEDEINEQR